MLFQLDLSGGTPDQIFEDFWSTVDAGPDVRAFAEQLVRGTVEDVEQLDATIAGAAEHWRVERMATVDRNVLRLATYELIRDPDVPAAVVMDEAIEIAKKYGSEDSGKFINGILDGIRRRL